MNTFSHLRRVSARVLNSAGCALLVAAVMSACGGGGGPSTPVGRGPVVSPTPPPPPPAGFCTEQQYAAAWESLACPAGMLCIGEVSGNDLANITVLTRGNRPDWSPDGSQLVFERTRSSNPDAADIFRIDADGSGEVKLASGREPAWSPETASPGGSKIAYRNNAGIAVMDPDGSNPTTLIRHDFLHQRRDARVSAPAWSPDGQRIVFVERDDSRQNVPQLYVMQHDGAGAQALTDIPGWSLIMDPAWSPDGGSIAFNQNLALAVVDAGGGEIKVIDSGFPGAWSYRSTRSDWSPDGSVIAFTTRRDCAARHVATTGAQGGTSQQLVAGAHQPAWSPDGTRLAFASAIDGYPPVPRSATVFDLEGLHFSGGRSRYVLFDDGNFELQSLSLEWGYSRFAGTYEQEADTYQFAFDNKPPTESHRWRAAGNLDGTRLTIKYNDAAAWSDFEDGVYILNESPQ